LQVGITVHLEEVVGREGQGVQVGDGRMIGVMSFLLIVGEVADTQETIEQAILRVE
jgi:hypothetical protein